MFWSYYKNPTAIGPRKGGSNSASAAYYTRQMTPIQNDQNLRHHMFKGTQGIDYDRQTIIMAPINRDHCDVVMDKTQTLNPIGEGMPRVQHRKHYFKGGRIIYDGDEAGSVVLNSEWSTLGRRSRGNLYILDIFGDGGFSSDRTTKGQFLTEGRLYWTE